MHQKECNLFVKFVHRVLIRNALHFMVCLWICVAIVEYGIAVLFAERAAIWRNGLHFHGKSATIQEKRRKDCGALQDGTLSGSAAHTEG